MARDQDLDLVEISPTADPPVCRIMDFGKYRYEQQKREKEMRRNSQHVEMKEIRFRPHTDTHDFNFKVKHARAFLLAAEVDNRRFPSAWGRTRKEAEHWAAHEALLVLEEQEEEC